MRFGLDRMHKLMTVLGLPQRRFASIHVVGHERQVLDRAHDRRDPRAPRAAHRRLHSRRTCARSRERIEVGEQPSSERRLRRGGQRARRTPPSWSTARSDAGRPVTQFEALTAAAYHELARARGRGRGDRGRARRPLRRDQRDPLARSRCSPTSGSSTRAGSGRRSPTSRRRSWPSCATTAARSCTGGARPPRRAAVAERGRRGAPRPDRAAPRRRDVRRLRAPAARFQRRNFALAARGRRGLPRRARRRRRAARGGRARACRAGSRSSASDPLTLYDGAHNPSGAAALAEALPEVLGGRPLVGVVLACSTTRTRPAMLARAAAAAASASCSRAARTRARSRRATLESLAEQLGGPPSETVADPRAAVERARELAGPDGAVLATGSIYLVADLVREQRGAARASTPVNDDGGPELPAHDRARRARRGDRDPGLLRDRLRCSAGLPLGGLEPRLGAVRAPSTTSAPPCAHARPLRHPRTTG